MARVLRMPGVAANVTEAVLSEWLVEESGEFAAADALATVETEDLGESHYRYHLTVDWPGLERIATLAHVDLNAALAD